LVADRTFALSVSFYSTRSIVERRVDVDVEVEFSVFIGLYNAEHYLASILDDLRNQSMDCNILIVDNASTDSTWDLIQDWLELFPGRITLARNSVNLGGGGSLLRNLDLIRSEWFATWHQDDHYFCNHLETLAESARNSEVDVVCVATDMGRLQTDGALRGSPVRASWFLPDHTPITVFLTNMRLHNFPFPSAAFRTKVFETYAAPWHSAAFPDTEWILNASADLKRVLFVDKVTMEYRENPSGESRSLTSREQLVGSFLALARVVNSQFFVKLCRTIPAAEREAFARYLLDSVEIRLKNRKTVEIVTLMAIEQMAHSWNYSEAFTLSELESMHTSIGGHTVAALAGRLLANYGEKSKRHPREKSDAVLEWLVDASTWAQPSARSTSLASVTGIVPKTFLKRIVKAVGPHVPLPRKHAWRTRWK
jgi:glycosyltransferase involved in cell wall biosynthesis